MVQQEQARECGAQALHLTELDLEIGCDTQDRVEQKLHPDDRSAMADKVHQKTTDITKQYNNIL